MGSQNNKMPRESIKTFPMGGFILGFFFMAIAYAILYLFKTVNFTTGHSLWMTLRTLHGENPVLFVVDSLPVVLGFVGLVVGIKQEAKFERLKTLRMTLEQQNRRLKSIQSLYTIIFERTDDGLLVTTKEGEIIDINWTGAKLLGITSLTSKKPESKDVLIEILKRNRINVKTVFADEEERERILERLEKKGSLSNAQVELKRFKGKPFNAMLSGFLGESSNGGSLIFWRIIDLSHVKQAELLLRNANEQLEKKNEELIKAFSELQALKVQFENRSKEFERANKQLKIANKMLSDMAYTDGLTGLYNHKHFMELLEKEWERAQRSKSSFCVVMIDVDYFKTFNDKWGHQLGDKALQSLANTIKKQTRSYDIVARYGGEEFSLVLPETELNTCYTVAQRIRRAVEKKILLIKSQDEKVSLTVSVGVTIFLPDQDDPRTYEQVLQDADVALYLAKNRGRNRVEMYRRDFLAESAVVVPIPELNGKE